MRKHLVSILSLSLLLLMQAGRAQDDGIMQGMNDTAEGNVAKQNSRKNDDFIMPDISANVWDEGVKNSMNEKYQGGKLLVLTVDSIEPEGGPTSGNTRVLVRGGPFKDLESNFPKPLCRFGRNDLVVAATYVTCSESPTHIKANEPRHNNKTSMCLQCDNSPEYDKSEIIPFTITLTGDFSDCYNSMPFRYYLPTKIISITPRYGPKDGDTLVTVIGENFLNFDEDTVCNFGSKAVRAHFYSSTMMTCQAPQSDVVEKAIPFSVSMNKQQQSRDKVDFWYYNWPSITEIVPNFGPDTGGNKVLIKGQNFNPFIGTEIDNSNDTFAEFEGIGKVQLHIINSTKAWCIAPPNFVLEKTYVEVTLNNQQFTDDDTEYFYFRPPQVFDIDPREGPTKGGTKVTVYGNRFKDSKNITCKFGDKITRGKFMTTNQILCVSPRVERPGWVSLTISYEGERYSSESVKYLYYETPVLSEMIPTCGPVTGYTQITLFGKNFLNMGFGKAKCVFNNTFYMNATIMEDNIMKCDSPPLPGNLGFADEHAPFYNISITLNGKELTTSNLTFIYYIDPILKSIRTNRGPRRGGTNSTLTSKGFRQEGVCNVTVRYGAIQVKPNNYSDTEMNITSPPANIPDAVVVSVALNGQQFIRDKTLHYRDIENTFTYYQDLFISDYSPKAGPTYGKTKITVEGMGFQQFKYDDGKIKEEPIWVRFVDSETGLQIGEPTEATNVQNEEFSWRTPPAAVDTKAILELSYNKQDWQKVIPPGKNYSYLYYAAPQITQITPRFGPVKSPNNETIDIIGKNFQCPEPDCKDLYVRFGDPENPILVKGTKVGDDRVRCSVPKYTQPDVLPVEITFNGQDYTHDNQTYGFFDPYVLDVRPRLINVRGTTKVRLYGFGFVNSTGTDLKTKFGTVELGNLTCLGKDCVEMAEYIDKSTIETPTFPQAQVLYQNTGSNIEFNGMTVEACVYGNTFTENNIEIWYYADPIYQSLDHDGSPLNMEKPIFAKTNFKWDVNDPERFIKYSNFSCRFQSLDGKRTVYTKGKMEVYPLPHTHTMEDAELPTHVRCSSPRWKLAEPAKLDISVNGQDYGGNFNYDFWDELDLYRIVPMAGPNEGATNVKIFGSGFTSTKEDVLVRWGVIETEKILKDQVVDYIYNETDFIGKAMVEGSEVLMAYKKEAYQIEKKDFELEEGQKLKTYNAISPRLPKWNATHGGPIYMSVGELLRLNITNNTDSNNTNYTYYGRQLYTFSVSFIEYFYYKQPVIKKCEPLSGLTRGGTHIEISGAWFMYKPEYGVVPHCKIGDKVVRAEFWSTVRIVCVAPPNENINSYMKISVSLNGVDYVDSGFKFHYYESPILYKMSPVCGPEVGGTQIHITGAKFSNISDPQNFNCRFSSIEHPNIPPKYIPAVYENQTTIMCSSPGGWGSGGDVKVQVTFNGEDYSENNFTFSFYNIQKAFPRSGPSDGTGGPILIIGSGFKNDTDILCSLDKTLYEPLEIQGKVIKCPMAKAKGGNDFFGNVELAIIIDGNWHKFTGGFQYYPQIILDDMFPHIGPSEGKGIVHIYGRNFRDDFPLQEVGCKIGESVGKARVISSTEMRCVVEEMELVDEGMKLPVTASLNSYSWVPTNETFYYVPYGVTGVFPNSGPYEGGTDILITGKGFDENAEAPKCRFGIPSDFAIVEAQVLSYDKMTCRSPADFHLPATADSTLSVPIGVAFQDEEFEPWTESLHRFRFYQQPYIVRCEPDEVEVGKMMEVYVFADENSEFWEPIPTSKQTIGQYGIECKFGRFGIGVGVYLNKTTIKCLTPSVSDDPDSIWRETVRVTVALNGEDFDEDRTEADFSFVGSGSTLVFWPWIVGTLLIGLLIVALVVFCSALFQQVNFKSMVAVGGPPPKPKDRPYVIRDPYNQFTSRGYAGGLVGRGSNPSGSQQYPQSQDRQMP